MIYTVDPVMIHCTEVNVTVSKEVRYNGFAGFGINQMDKHTCVFQV